MTITPDDVVQTMQNIGFTEVSKSPTPAINDHYTAQPDVVSVLRFGTTFTFYVYVTLSTGMIHVVENGEVGVQRPFNNTSLEWMATELETIFDEFGSAPTVTEILGSYVETYRPRSVYS